MLSPPLVMVRAVESPTRENANMKWHWEPVDVTRSSAAGDVSKLFKNEAVKEPGVLADGAPPATDTVLAREVIQNSWDAARELVESSEEEEAAHNFHLDFEFREVGGSDKSRLVGALGLGELRERLEAIEASIGGADTARTQLGLASGLRSIDTSNDPLRLLEIREHGTTGMYGPFSGTSSKLYLALVSVGFTLKDQGSGGSYGYGKAGLIGGSATRTVIAYTCFRERADDPGVTRRLLGMTYWGRHELGGESFTGFGRFGCEHGDEAPIPFENEEADDVAEMLGLTIRSPEELGDLGTTFLLVEPTVEPEPLNDAIERNWWPALEVRAFDIDIYTYEGKHIVPWPSANPVLAPFIRGFELATMPQDSGVVNEWSRKFRRLTTGSGNVLELGTLGLVADLGPEGWSYPANGLEDTRHASLVALIRGPHMVVEYLECGTSMPFVRGAFLAAGEVDERLRQTEPKGHDSWRTKGDLDGVDSESVEVARAIVARIKQQVSAFRRGLRPTGPPRQEARLPTLEGLFRRVLDGNSTRPSGPSRAGTVDVNITEQELHPSGNGIRLVGRATFSLAEHVGVPSVDVDIRIRYLFLEDGRSGEECPVSVSPPEGFVAVGLPGAFRGALTHDRSEFRFETAPYDPDWSGKLSVIAEPLLQGPAT